MQTDIKVDIKIEIKTATTGTDDRHTLIEVETWRHLRQKEREA